jgi:hypothetical protein
LTLPIHPWLTDEEIKNTCDGILNNLWLK